MPRPDDTENSHEAHLLSLLEVIELNPGIAAQLTTLLKAARASKGWITIPARARLLREVFDHLRKRLASARLNERGRKMGIE